MRMQLIFDPNWCIRKATIIESTKSWRLDSVSLRWAMTIKWAPKKTLFTSDGRTNGHLPNRLGRKPAQTMIRMPIDSSRTPCRRSHNEPQGYGPMPVSNIGRTSDSPSNSGQYFRCNSINSVAIRTASDFESVFKIAQPPMTSLVSVKGPSNTVIFPLPSRTRKPSLLGCRPPVSTRVPSLREFYTNLPIHSISAAGGSAWR